MQRDPSNRFRDLTLNTFLERLSSAEPVPGGGSASAVVASLGAGLVTMVATLSQGRPAYADHAALHERAKAAGTRLVERFLQLADDDAAEYSLFVAALKLPKGNAAEIAARTEAMGAAARRAAEAPLECVVACLELVSIAEQLAGRSNRNASSDLNVAALLAEAAARGAAANVRVNLPSVTDQDFVGDAMTRVDDLLHEITRLADATREVVLSGDRREPLPDPGAGTG